MCFVSHREQSHFDSSTPAIREGGFPFPREATHVGRSTECWGPEAFCSPRVKSARRPCLGPPCSAPTGFLRRRPAPAEPLPSSNHSDFGGPLCFNKDGITESQSFPPFQVSSLPGFPLKVKRCQSRPKKGLNQDAKLF